MAGVTDMGGMACMTTPVCLQKVERDNAPQLIEVMGNMRTESS